MAASSSQDVHTDTKAAAIVANDEYSVVDTLQGSESAAAAATFL